MPSNESEPIAELIKLEPSLVGWLLSNLFGVEVPDYDHARPHASTSNYQMQSEWGRSAVARGAAKALLILLEERGMAVSEEVRDRIMDCTDFDQQDIWLRRAITATTVDDVVCA